MIQLCVMTSVCPDMTLDETLAAMNRHGYAGLEPRIEWGHAQGIELTLSAAERADVKQRVAAAGLAIPCVATSVSMGKADADARAKQVQDGHASIDLAADIGCPMIRTFGREVLQGVEMKASVDWMIAGYRQVVDHAADRGVTVLLETHDVWCNSAHVAAVVDGVAHPNLRVLWDVMHPQRFCEKSATTFANIGHLTRHLHAHDGTYVDDGCRMATCPLGEGVVDHAEPLRLLAEAGFDGYFSVEVIHAPGSDHDAQGVMAQYAKAFGALMADVAK